MPDWLAEAAGNTVEDSKAKSRIKNSSYSTSDIFLGFRRQGLKQNRLQVFAILGHSLRESNKGQARREQQNIKGVCTLTVSEIATPDPHSWESDTPKRKKKHTHKKTTGNDKEAHRLHLMHRKRGTVYRSHPPLPNLVLPCACFVCSFMFRKFNAFSSGVRNSNCLPI